MPEIRQQNHRQLDRRVLSDRRRGDDRRRGTDNRIVVFELCRSTLHLVLIVRRGPEMPDKVITRSIQWRRQSTSIHTDLGARELRDAFRTFVADERLAGTSVRIALNGGFCVTRVVTGTTESVRRELGELEERTHRYLTLGPGRKALATTIEQIDARHQRAQLTVANERTLQILIAIAESVGIQVETIEPSLVGLSRTQSNLRGASEQACLIIELDQDMAEIGICHRGRLLLDYRPGGHTDADNVANLVVQHLGRVQRYLDRHHAYLKEPIGQVYLTGDLDAVNRARGDFIRFRHLQVHVLDPSLLTKPWEHASGPPTTATAAALGTSLISYLADPDQQSLNLMDRILAASREPIRPILIRSLLPLAGVLLIAVGLLAAFLLERRNNQSIRAELDRLAPARARATELSLQTIAADQKLAQLQQLEMALPKPNSDRLLTHISQSMPDDVWLHQLSLRDGQSASLSGAGYTDGGVYDLVGYLKHVPDVVEVSLEGTGVSNSPTGPTTSFELQLSLASPGDSADREVRHD